jgi:hypothetical protein
VSAKKLNPGAPASSWGTAGSPGLEPQGPGTAGVGRNVLIAVLGWLAIWNRRVLTPLRKLVMALRGADCLRLGRWETAAGNEAPPRVVGPSQTAGARGGPGSFRPGPRLRGLHFPLIPGVIPGLRYVLPRRFWLRNGGFCTARLAVGWHSVTAPDLALSELTTLSCSPSSFLALWRKRKLNRSSWRIELKNYSDRSTHSERLRLRLGPRVERIEWIGGTLLRARAPRNL